MRILGITTNTFRWPMLCSRSLRIPHFVWRISTSIYYVFQWVDNGKLTDTRFLCRLCSLLHHPKPPPFHSEIQEWWGGPGDGGQGICNNASWSGSWTLWCQNNKQLINCTRLLKNFKYTRLEAPSRVPLLPSFQLIFKHDVSSCIWLSTFILIG